MIYVSFGGVFCYDIILTICNFYGLETKEEDLEHILEAYLVSHTF
jgi:hypothetical protein